MSGERRWFRPSGWVTLATLLTVGLFTAAGVWQLRRAGEKQALLAAFEAAPTADVLRAPLREPFTDALRFRLASARGHYDGEHQVLLDARTRGGKAGYEVLTPLITDQGALLVNRGWLPANPDRTRWPLIEVASDERELRGRLDRLPTAPLVRTAPATDPHAPWPRRLLYPTAAVIGTQLGYRVPDYQLLLEPSESDGFRRDWNLGEMPPIRHVGYAVQWFALAAACVVLYVVLNLRKETASRP